MSSKKQIREDVPSQTEEEAKPAPDGSQKQMDQITETDVYKRQQFCIDPGAAPLTERLYAVLKIGTVLYAVVFVLILENKRFGRHHIQHRISFFGF